jgi:hypothetical protein
MRLFSCNFKSNSNSLNTSFKSNKDFDLFYKLNKLQGK